jgi:hypothetical protein
VQVPNNLLQPVPQYAVVDPHHPLLLQQFPNVEPWHVNPPVPPHVASALTFFVALATGALDVLVLVAKVLGFVVVERVDGLTVERVDGLTVDRVDGLTVDRVTGLEELTTVPVQVPKAGLHSVPQ